MTLPVDLIERATAAGLELILAGDRLRVCGPDPLPTELLAELRERKAELLVMLAERDPLPPVGDPRRPALELIDDVWAAGCRVVIAGGAAHVEARESSAAVPAALRDRLRVLERDVVDALTRRPWEGE